MSYFKIEKDLLSLADKQQAANLSRFFKTKKGDYGYGDKFLGIKVPLQRKIVRLYSNTSLTDIKKLLNNVWHEFRLVGVLLLVSLYENSRDKNEQKKLAKFYLENLYAINNWDLVDLSAPNILGNYLYNHFLIYKKDRQVIFKLKEMACSSSLWIRRIAVVSTFYFIKKGSYQEIFYLVNYLKNDNQDLIHKALGWMLREVGKRINMDLLTNFLEDKGASLPRTTLRYAIEKYPYKKRQYFLNLKNICT